MNAAPPSRQSIRSAYIDWNVAGRTEVLLDGVVQVGVLEYDCNAGVVTRQVRDAKGDIQLSPMRDAVREETLTGTVTVRWRDTPYG